MSAYRAKLAADQREGQAKADAFNAAHPIGTPVVAYPGVRPEDPLAVAVRERREAGRHVDAGSAELCQALETVTRTPAWTLGNGEPVVSVEGYAGGICLSHVDVVQEVSA